MNAKIGDQFKNEDEFKKLTRAEKQTVADALDTTIEDIELYLAMQETEALTKRNFLLGALLMI